MMKRALAYLTSFLMLTTCMSVVTVGAAEKKDAKPNNEWMSALFVDGHVEALGEEKKISPYVSASRKEMKDFVGNGTRDLRSNKVIHRSFDAVDPNAPKANNRIQRSNE